MGRPLSSSWGTNYTSSSSDNAFLFDSRACCGQRHGLRLITAALAEGTGLRVLGARIGRVLERALCASRIAILTDNYSQRGEYSMIGDLSMLEKDMEGLIPLCNFKMTTEKPLLLDDLVIRRLSQGEINVIAQRTSPLIASKCEFGIQSRWKERAESMNRLTINITPVLDSEAIVPALRLFDAGEGPLLHTIPMVFSEARHALHR